MVMKCPGKVLHSHRKVLKIITEFWEMTGLCGMSWNVASLLVFHMPTDNLSYHLTWY